VGRLGESGSQFLEHRPGVEPDVHLPDRRQADLDQRWPCDIGAGVPFLPYEAVISEHGQQPVRR